MDVNLHDVHFIQIGSIVFIDLIVDQNNNNVSSEVGETKEPSLYTSPPRATGVRSIGRGLDYLQCMQFNALITIN